MKKCVRLDDVGERDWLGVIFGLTGKGRYEEAKSVVKEITSPSARTTAYTQIARGQAESGDQAAARTTLLLGLDEVLNQKDVVSFFNGYGMQVEESKDDNLITILEAMAAVGLDDDVNDKLKFVSTSDLPRALLWIGRAQGSPPSIGGRGDREAAKATLRRAIQIERMRADKAAADANLVEIVSALAEVGLFNDARQTVLLIKNAEVRKVAEHKIAWHEEQLR